jgi:hypothetical protein
MAAGLARYLRKADLAGGFLERAIAMNPAKPSYRAQFAAVLAERGEWEKAEGQCREWVSRDPCSVEARRLWVGCLARLGRRAEAEKEFRVLEALNPPNLGELREQLRSLLR